jgi:hypothetical protein
MKTAVEWLVHELGLDCTTDHEDEIHEALEMEKKQIIDAFDEGQEYEYQYHINSAHKFDSETYYNETFKSE